VTKIYVVVLDKSHVTLVANDKRYWIKNNSTNTSSSLDSIVYILSHMTKMQLFWSQLKANDVMPHVSIFNFKNNNYNHFEIIYDI
jgi:hypothetical protein